MACGRGRDEFLSWLLWLLKSGWQRKAHESGRDTTPSGRHEIPPPSGPDQQDPMLFGVGVVVKSWCNRRSALILTSPWRSGPARPAFAPLTAPQTPLHVQDPYFCSARETEIQGISHIACIRLPGPSAALPLARDLARCPSGVVWHQQSGPCHRHTTLSDTNCLSKFNTVQADIIILSFWSDRAVAVVCALAT